MTLEIPIDMVEDEEESSSKTYRLDLENGRIIGTVEKLEAVNQAIIKAIKTERFYNLIYDNDYGSEIKDLIYDNRSSRELIETALPELIKDALSQEARIIDIYDFNFEFQNDACYISFMASTIFGDTEVHVNV